MIGVTDYFLLRSRPTALDFGPLVTTREGFGPTKTGGPLERSEYSPQRYTQGHFICIRNMYKDVLPSPGVLTSWQSWSLKFLTCRKQMPPSGPLPAGEMPDSLHTSLDGTVLLGDQELEIHGQTHMGFPPSTARSWLSNLEQVPEYLWASVSC